MRRISIINSVLWPRDATGNCMIQQANFFLEQGDDVKIYLQESPNNIPEHIQAICIVVFPNDLNSNDHEHFYQSDLYIYH